MKKTFDVEHFTEELRRKCALTEIKKFKKNEIITTYLLKRNQMHILLKGEAYLARYDKEGNRRIIYYLRKNDIFGEAFYKLHTDRELFVVAKKDCEVLLFHALFHKGFQNCLYRRQCKNFSRRSYLFEVRAKEVTNNIFLLFRFNDIAKYRLEIFLRNLIQGTHQLVHFFCVKKIFSYHARNNGIE